MKIWSIDITNSHINKQEALKSNSFWLILDELQKSQKPKGSWFLKINMFIDDINRLW